MSENTLQKENTLTNEPPSPLVVECRNVTKTVGLNREQNLTILADLNFRIWQGEMVAIVGASGSGKTTLLGLLGGLEVPTGGQVFIQGEDISRMSERPDGNHGGWKTI